MADSTDLRTTRITDRRSAQAGPALWVVNEFDGGKRYMLTLDAAGTHFAAHFDRKQWQEFRSMIAPALTDSDIRRMADENPCPACDGHGTTEDRPDSDGNWDYCLACDGSGVKDGV